jgi:Ion channel
MSADSLARAYLAHRYALLFYSLLLTLGAGPLLAALDVDRDWIRLFLELNVFAAVFGVTGLQRRRPLLLSLVVIVALRVGAFVFDVHPLGVAGQPLVTALALVTAAAALRFALRARRVDAEHVYAALAAYLLAGVFGGVLYQEIERHWPGSFATGDAPLTDFPVSTGIYFSFVTLATLGYGDVVPKSEVARGIAIVEAIAGQLYLAVMVARLVSIYARPMPRDREGEHPQREAS